MGLADRDLIEEERQRQRLNDAAVAREIPRPQAMDQGTKRLAIIAGGLGALLVMVVGGWSLLGPRPPAGIPVLSPPPGPVRVKPVDPGGMQLMGTQVAQTNGPAAQALAAPPEAAAPQALQAEVQAARHADATPTPPRQANTIAPPLAAPPLQAAAPPAPAPETKPAPATVPPEADHAVQLAALGSDAAAHAEWNRLTRQAPDLFADHTPRILRIVRGDVQLFRLRTAGFPSLEAARTFCGQARNKGITCTLADF